MAKCKVLKAFMLGLCISLLSTGAAFASESSGGQSAGFEGSKTLIEDRGSIDPVNPSDMDSELVELKEAVLIKQKEIDQYVFSDHADELYEMGFKVVYTGPSDDVVEIGITPYQEEFANFLYEKFGKDNIIVVEGEQAYLYTTMVDEPASDTPVSSEEDERYVGEDMVLEDGEFGITSITDDQERYVGDDLVLEEGEMGVVSVGEGDILLEDSSQMAESGIITNTSTQSNSNNPIKTVIICVIAVAFLGIIAASTVMILKKKGNK
jgi:hypothetical protein